MYSIEIRLVTEIIGIKYWHLANSSEVGLFYVLQIGEDELIFLDLDQNVDQPKVYLIVPRTVPKKTRSKNLMNVQPRLFE